MNIHSIYSEKKKACRGNKASKLMRRLTVLVFMVMALTGRSAAQITDPAYVIVYEVGPTVHYLSHVKEGGVWKLQDATEFSPSCIWYSGTTFNPSGDEHNYYFYADGEYRFLAAPLEVNGELYLSDSLPGTSILRNTDMDYYFYDWDKDTYGGGVARGKRHYVTQGECTYSWGDNQCWQVYWVEYDAAAGPARWRLTSASYYHRDDNPAEPGAHYQTVDTVWHDEDIVSVESGGITIADFEMEYNTNHPFNITAGTYSYTRRPAFMTYNFGGAIHNYYNGTDNGTSEPGTASSTGNSPTAYEWTITGDGAQYLSFSNSEDVRTISGAISGAMTPTIYYKTLNDGGHKTATVTITVTYGENGPTQVSTFNITVKTPCQHPAVADPVVSYEDVTVSWIPTAESYKVYLKKHSEGEGAWTSVTVGNVTSHVFTNLVYGIEYDYKIAAICNGVEVTSPAPTVNHFTTNATPGVLVYGAVFGGGRMASVSGKTEVVIINCDTISAVYGGNDIAGSVGSSDGSLITLGVDASVEALSYSHLYNNDAASSKVRIGSVYGGGNGYYAYNGASFRAADKEEYTSQTVVPDGVVRAMTRNHQLGDIVFENTSGENTILTFPSIVKTAIVVTNNVVKVDSIFGGAKNAFLTANSGNGSEITVYDGTVFAVFGGNNFGGGQGYGKHHIEIRGTNITLSTGISNGANSGYGRSFGIRYVFGGGNKVYGSTTEVFVYGGQVDTLFGGGNSADVYAANVTVNCAVGSRSDYYTFGSIYSNAITEYSEGTITLDNTYAWNGNGIYNVRALFGGNNAATMAAVPAINLTSGSIGIAYGGGNAGDMLAAQANTINGNSVNCGTHITMDSPTILIDYLYGGCQKSNVDYSTWVEVKNGHVGTVYGGCNISGDVGSTRIYPSAPTSEGLSYQAVQGATYVEAMGGTVHGNIFAGSNGFYHCNNGVSYISGMNYDDTPGYYIGLQVPTHNETNVILRKNTAVNPNTEPHVMGNVYAGGNLACVGFTNATANKRPYPRFVGMSSVIMSAGTVDHDVYGGGNMASIYGSNEVQVSGGIISGALYGGNDRTGQVAQITNRILPDDYSYASDGKTPLADVHTYIGITGKPQITTVYGGGNGAYDYSYNGASGDYDPSTGKINFCNKDDKPIQTNTFVDIGIDGDNNETPRIGTVYGGGNGVTVTGSIAVLLNVQSPNSNDDVATIFGGNNMGNLALVPDIILLSGRVHDVYGGCNQGAMTADTSITIGTTTYTNIGSFVRLRNTYVVSDTTFTPVAVVSGSVYGGCRMNGVTRNSLVLVEGGNHSDVGIYGGSDISGNVCGISRVIVSGGTVGTVYGGGNGNYFYNDNDGNAYLANDHDQLVAEGVSSAPYCKTARVDMLGGNAANLYAGGFAGLCGETILQMDDGTVSGSLYGGGNQAGVTTTNLGCTAGNGNSTITMNGGTVQTAVYGGCNAAGNIDGAVAIYVNDGTVGTGDATDGIFGGGYGASTTTSGNVTVNIGNTSAASAAACPEIYADIYGGSALGRVNTNTGNTTTVNIINGAVNGNVYGGGLGQAVLNAYGYRDNTADSVLAVVNGNVVVNIGTSEQASNFVTINGDVFGCNNLAGSPAGTVTVNVYRTAHTTGDTSNSVPTGSQLTLEQMAAKWYAITAPDDEGSYNGYYAINAVYGGGNLAHKTSSGQVSVNIWNCDNSIKYVYGGGNAANILGSTAVTVYGGHIYQVFGGGNGFGTGNPGANITGTASTTIYGGYMHYVFGGSNSRGTIGTQSVLISTRSGEGVCFSPVIYNFFAGGNMATSTGDLSTTIDNCDVKFYNLYGGANQANITGNVTLNVRGGTYMNIYGGSNAANITGNVALNFYGGTATNIFGGNNTSGTISGSIKVIVDVVDDHCPTALENVYGGGNLADYTAPDSASKNYPRVDIRNANISGSVYGGGKGVDNENKGVVTGNPQVIFHATSNSRSVACGYIYGGGNAGPVTGNPNILIDGGTVRQSVFGGGYGARAQVTGSTTVLVKGPANIGENVYGGGNAGIVTGSTNVQIGDAAE
ncbi:MAG: fibronectin type III domain-containing protein [Bacteroidales bacterium]|nr:fibronectin type III domain-containing protein [Bacteroidales bacterium]